MVTSVSSSAAYLSAAMLSNQCAGARGAQAQQPDKAAFQEKLFSKLDANGDGGIDASELSDFMSYAATQGSGSTPQTDSAQLFNTLDSDGDGSVSQSELAQGAKSLFDALRAQLMSSSDGASGAQASSASSADKPDAQSLFAQMDANGDGSIDQNELGTFMSNAMPPPPPPGEGGQGGLFAKIESLLDQYRSTATGSSSAETTSSLAVAA